jgi:hypothetical protein
MYLFHVTSYDYIEKILQDNELKSSKLRRRVKDRRARLIKSDK